MRVKMFCVSKHFSVLLLSPNTFLPWGKNIAENYVKSIQLKQCRVKQYVESWKYIRITDSVTDINTVRTLVIV